MTRHVIRIDQRPRHKANVSTASLLARLGAHAAARFGSRLARIELAPAHAGILGLLAASPGIS